MTRHGTLRTGNFPSCCDAGGFGCINDLFWKDPFSQISHSSLLGILGVVVSRNASPQDLFPSAQRKGMKITSEVQDVLDEKILFQKRHQ
jgi:hypothetical protein